MAVPVVPGQVQSTRRRYGHSMQVGRSELCQADAALNEKELSALPGAGAPKLLTLILLWCFRQRVLRPPIVIDMDAT